MVVAAALSACSPSPPTAVAEHPQAVTNGSNDAGDPGVVALLQGSTLVCTATLVAPRLILTAAHCLADGAMPTVYFGSTPGDGAPRLAISAVRRHPSFDAAQPTNDIAMALLADPAPASATAAPLPAAPPAAGAMLRLVGFGRTSAGDTTAPRKRVGTATLSSLTATELAFLPSPSQTCEGDSGGPAFATAGGVESIVGVTSSGDAACATMARDIRVDAFADAFIAPFVAATTEGAAGAGDRCWYAGNCGASAGECAPATDDATLSFCAPSCDGGCPSGLHCVAGSDGRKLCRHPTPSPGAQGSRCSDDATCAAGHCVAHGAGSPTVCATSCFADLPGFCGPAFDCLAVAGGAQSACFARATGGCDFAGGGAPLRSPMLVAALLLWLRRRPLSRA